LRRFGAVGAAIADRPGNGPEILDERSLTIINVSAASKSWQLFRNGRIRQHLELTSEAEPDFLAVVKLFTPKRAAPGS
jgi:hypothetical protein